MILMTLGDSDESDELDEMLSFETKCKRRTLFCLSRICNMVNFNEIFFLFKLNSMSRPQAGRFYQKADISLRVSSLLHFFSSWWWIPWPKWWRCLGFSWVAKKWEKGDRNCHTHACEADLDWSSMNCKLWWDSHILPTFISAAGAGLPGYNSHNVAGENGLIPTYQRQWMVLNTYSVEERVGLYIPDHQKISTQYIPPFGSVCFRFVENEPTRSQKVVPVQTELTKVLLIPTIWWWWWEKSEEATPVLLTNCPWLSAPRMFQIGNQHFPENSIDQGLFLVNQTTRNLTDFQKFSL